MQAAAIGTGAESGTRAHTWPWRIGVLLAGAGIFVGAKAVAERWWEPFIAGWEVLPGKGSPLRAFAQHALAGNLVVSGLCLLGWWALSRFGLLSSPRGLLTLGEKPRRTLLVGLVVSAVMLAYTLLFAVAAGIPFQFQPQPWLMAGNVFSNLYEEVIYRAFLIHIGLVGLRNRQLALVFSALVFAAVHEQYPWEYRLIMLPVSWLFGFAYVRAGSLLASWIPHQVVDMVGDTVLDV